MRIVVSGTHASGKSTLISDFALRHPRFTVLPDPFEVVDDAAGARDMRSFAAQLRVAADRLTSDDHGVDVIAERGPLDFLAYLLAAAELAGTRLDDALLERAMARTTAALSAVDILIVLPLSAADAIDVDDDEDPQLRDLMNDVLLDLLDDAELTGDDLAVVEITGSPAARLALLESAVDASR